MYQWARIRFGVFDESPQNGEPELYPVENGEDYEGSRCSLQIPGMVGIVSDAIIPLNVLACNSYNIQH